MSCSSSSSPHQRTPNHPSKRARVTILPSTSSESFQAPLSSHSAAAGTVSDTTSRDHEGYDIVKLLKAFATFRLRNGISPTMPRCLPDFLKEVKEFVPKGLSEKQLSYMLSRLRYKFRNGPIPGPNCPDFDRSLFELGVKVWGPRRVRTKGNTGVSVKRNGKDYGLKNKRKGDEESDSEELDKDEADSPYNYLKHVLEDFWIAKNLDLNVLQLALQKVDSVEAKRLDEQFMEIAKGELKLKMEKNSLSNEIINVLCIDMQRW